LEYNILEYSIIQSIEKFPQSKFIILALTFPRGLWLITINNQRVRAYGAYLTQHPNETLTKEIWSTENATKTALNYQKIIKSGMINSTFVLFG
jgi:hypothetical protein